jgi:SNF2 family DNA or RNA helicase
MFPSLSNFERLYVDYYFQGNSYKPGGLKYPEEFKQKTRDFIIRRTREEVMPELPKIQRDFKFYELGQEVRKAYNSKVKKLDEFLRDSIDEKSPDFYTELIAHLSILRHITGIAKIAPVLEFVDEFVLNETNGEEKKLVIFHHHVDVGDLLSAKLDELLGAGKTLRITSADSSETRLDKIEQFRSGDSRILLIPTLAGGEGINLQFCSSAVILEREWNPANEEQAEGRFSRIGSTAKSVSITYPTATGTIDEYFAEIVERKRQIVGEALDGEKKATWDNSSIMLELANIVVKKWRLN